MQEVTSWWQQGDSLMAELTCGHTVEITSWWPSLYVPCSECRALSNHQNAADPPVGGAAEVSDVGGESVQSRAGR